MVQRKSFDLNLARTAGMLTGARRVAMLLLATLLLTMTAQTAWADKVEPKLSVDPDIPEGTAGHYYINMPLANDQYYWLTLTSADITDCKGTFKVYDDGGKDSNYSDNCKRYLILTAPTGYVCQLSGSITTEAGDFLTVYDGNTTNKLLNRESSPSDGTETAIPTVVSSGTIMRLYFESNGSKNYAGLDLTVTLINPNAEYNITMNNATGGSIASNKSTAKLNDVVTLTATPSNGYLLNGLSIVDASSHDVAVDWNVWTNSATFKMPASAVTVTPTFTNDLTNLSINMPKTGAVNATIPAGVTSFKVYDDGGASGNYSYNCNGTLTLTAPTGYLLQLSGNITTDKKDDNLTVYDGNTTSGTKLLGPVSSTSNGTQTAINTVTSTDNNMTLCFKSDEALNYAGLDLTVTVFVSNVEHSITVNNATGGSVATTVGGASASAAKVNDVVTLTATPESGYVLSGISATDGSSNAVDIDWSIWANTATFTMPPSAVTVTPTFTNNLTNLNINMHETGEQTATIPMGVQSFQVNYDHYITSSGSSKLILTAPEGYLLQLSGTATLEGKDQAYFRVYDGDDVVNDTKLIDSSSSGNYTGVVSTGTVMTIYCWTIHNISKTWNLDLTVTLINTNTEYGITVNDATGGTVAASVGGNAVTKAHVHDVVTLTSTLQNGYMLSGISVKDGSNQNVNVTWDGPFFNTATFTMPASAVTVTPTYTNTLTAAGGLYINIPKTTTKTVTIPTGVQSFKVYDDGGAGSNYSNGCGGTLTLTAPEGYVLQLSGDITTEGSGDYLTVYDGSEANDEKKLLDGVSSTTDGTQTAITTVTSSGQSMTLYFSSNGSTNYAGLDLTVTLISTNTDYAINGLGTTTGGTVAATVGGTSASTAKMNNVVTLTASPSVGYVLSGISVTDGSSNAVAVAWDGIFSNTATFTMPASAVTVTPTFTVATADNGIYIDMPKTGEQTVTIPAGVTSFKVYDDGGAGSNYSNNCAGTLTLTAPEGYVLQLSGNITTEDGNDKLFVYDGSDNTANKLLDGVSSTTDGTQTAITTVISSGQSMTLYFSSNGDLNAAGLDLTVKVVDPNEGYTINGLGNVTGGSVAATVGGTSASTAKMNNVVTLTASPSVGYVLSGISVTDGSSNAVAVAWDGPFFNTATFKMPASAVTVTPTFTNDLTNLSVNMPTTGEQTVTIPAGVTSFKVYDNGGSTGNYSDNCDGTLILTAPTGYVLQLSGNITTEGSWDYLIVYDGSEANEASGTRLIDAYGTFTIDPVISSGQSMTLYFCSDEEDNYAGLDLTVTLISTNTEFDINGLGTTTGGTVAATVGGTSASTAKMNDVVTLTASPSEGYVLSGISVTDNNGNTVPVNWDIWANTATFKMPASAVTVTSTFTNDLTSLYINMPTTGSKGASIPAGVTSFKVYDDGGAAGNYSNNCDGALRLTAPEGYVLQLSGNIMTEANDDNLTVYDGSNNEANKLLDRVSSTTDGTQTPISTVTSTGPCMMLNFISHTRNNYAGLDLTVTLISTNTEFDINMSNPATGGTVAATVGGTSASTAKMNNVVTLTASPESGYVLIGISVTDNNGNTVPVNWDIWSNTATFKMPASAVTVTSTFTNDLTSLYINMPTTGSKGASIPAGVTSFKVYDDGGATGNYSDNCDGTLTLTAPEGYVLQLSGNITTEWLDRLTVYDGNEANDEKKLLDRVFSTRDGTQTAITTVTSTGQSMTLYFCSDEEDNYAGLDLTVTLISTNTDYAINGLGTTTGGTVAATVGGTSAAATAHVHDVVTLTVSPSEGYVLSGVSVTDNNGNTVPVNWDIWANTATFNMPASAVTVTSTFTNDLTSLYINMPTTGSKGASIPAGVTSFKVYDDGGAGSNYSNNCAGTLRLTAPTGYVLQLSGNITTEGSVDVDYLTVYDGSDNTANKLLDGVFSTTETAITPVTSTGQSMTLYFRSDSHWNYAGLDLTVTVKQIESESGTTVTLDENGYSVTVNEGSGSGGVIDGSILDGNGEVTVANLDYSRTLTAPGSGSGDVTIDNTPAKLYTTCQPEGWTKETGVMYYTLASVSGSTLHFTEISGNPQADTPYLVAVTGNSNVTEHVTGNNVTLKKIVTTTPVNGYTMIGTQTGLSNTDAANAAGTGNVTYILQHNAKWGRVNNANPTDVYIPPFRAFIVGPDVTTPSGARQMNSSFDDDGTGIDSIRTTDSDGTERWYDLNGRRIDRPTQKGVYIRNGKKIAQSRRER